MKFIARFGTALVGAFFIFQAGSLYQVQSTVPQVLVYSITGIAGLAAAAALG